MKRKIEEPYVGYSCTKDPLNKNSQGLTYCGTDVCTCINSQCSNLRYYGKPIFELENALDKKERAKIQIASSLEVRIDPQIEDRLKELGLLNA